MRFSEPVFYRLGQMTKDYKWWNGNGSSSYNKLTNGYSFMTKGWFFY